MNFGHWLHNAIKTAGRDIGSATKAVEKETGKIGAAIEKIPIAGPLFMAVTDLASSAFIDTFTVIQAAATGKNIVKAVEKRLKQELNDVKEIGPYAQMVIAMIPGIGPIVSGAISAGLALAEGQSITNVLEAAAAGALPGGAIAKAAFDMGKNVIENKGLKNFAALGGDLLAGVSAATGVPIPPAAQAAIMSGLGVAQDLAQGKKIATAIEDQANTAITAALGGLHLPAAATAGIKAGLMTGVSMAQGKSLQSAIGQQITSPSFVMAIGGAGADAIGASGVLQAAKGLVPSGGSSGFNIGIGCMKHAMGPHTFTTMRAHLSPADQKGFDMAVSMHIGRVTQVAQGSPKQQAGKFLMHGMSGANPDQKVMMLNAVKSDPEVMKGAMEASQEIIKNQNPSWWHKVLRFLHIEQ
jgi:hypothetical protein